MNAHHVSAAVLVVVAVFVCVSQAAAESPAAPSIKDDIAATVKAHSAEVRACYETALTKTPDLAGKLTVSFHIEPGGQVTSAAVQDSTLAHDGLERCVLTAVAGWRFAARADKSPLAVTYPFLFDTADR